MVALGEFDRLKHCGACGMGLIEIRGKHRGDLPRKVCATCLAEHMDQIRGIADSNYGMVSQATSQIAIAENEIKF